jgi:excisionase family DNA binding protein
LLTVREVAALLRVSPRTVYAMCAEGHLTHVRVMNAIRVAPAALAALLRVK